MLKKLLIISLSFFMVFSSIGVTKAATVIDLAATDGKIASMDYEERNGISHQSHGSDNVCTGNYETGRTISYRVNVPEKAGYKLSVSVAHDSRYGGPGEYGLSFAIYCDGTYLGEFSQDLEDTSPSKEDWHTHVLTEIKDLKIGLPAGEHTIMFEARCKNVNIDYWVLTEDGDYVEPPVIEDLEGTGALIKEDAVTVTASSAVKDGSSEWYKNEFEIPYKNTALENEDIREVDNMDITTIEVNPDTTYQEFLGMGTSLEESTINNLSKMSPAKQREILEMLVDPVNGMGLTMFRLTIGTSDFTAQDFYTYYDTTDGILKGEPDWYNETGNGFSIQKDIDYNIISTVKLLKEIAEEKGVLDEIKFFASPWSPPGWMKEDGDYTINWDNPYGLIGGELKDDCVDDWAKYLARFVEEYAKQGIDIYAITLQNEPQARVYYPCCYVSPKQEAEISILFKQYLNKSTILKDTQKGVKVWGWDHNPDNLVSYMSEAYKYENAIDGAAVHDYGGAYSNMTTLHNAYPEKEMHLSERSVWGVQGIDNIMQYFGNYCESYTMWVTMLDSNRGTHKWPGDPDPSLFIQNADDTEDYWATPEVYLFGQISKYVRPGYVRINSTYSASTNIKTVAFKDEDTGKCVLVVVNKGSLKENIAVVVGNGQFTTCIEGKTVATYIFNEGDFPVDDRVPVEIDEPLSFVDDSHKIYNASIDSTLNCLGDVEANGGANFYVNIPESGYYNVYVDVAAENTTARNLTLQFDKLNLQTVKVNAVNEGEVTTFRKVKFNVYLTKGKHDLDIVADSGSLNLKTVTFEKAKEIYNVPGEILGNAFIDQDGVFVEGTSAKYISTESWTNHNDKLTYAIDSPVNAVYTVTIKGEVLKGEGFWFDLYHETYVKGGSAGKYTYGTNDANAVYFSNTKVSDGVYTFTMEGNALKEGLTYFQIVPFVGSAFNIESITFTTDAAYDKTKLISLINQLKDEPSDKWTEQSYKNFTDALAHAIEVRDATPGLQADVENAYTELKEAYDSLELNLVALEIDEPLTFVEDAYEIYNAKINANGHLGNLKANGGASFYVNIPESGYYDVYVNAAAGYTSANPLILKVNGEVAQKSYVVAQAGDSWTVFRDVKLQVYLEEGKQTIDVVIEKGDIDLKTLTFKKAQVSYDVPGTVYGKDLMNQDGVFVEGNKATYISGESWYEKWDRVAYAFNVTEEDTYTMIVKGKVHSGANSGFWFDLYTGYNASSDSGSGKFTTSVVGGNNSFDFTQTEVAEGMYVFEMSNNLPMGKGYFEIRPFNGSSFDIEYISFVTTDKVELIKLISEVEDLKGKYYVEETFTPFAEALEEAIEVRDDALVEQAEINNAYETLKNAYDNLELIIIDKTHLEAAIAKAELVEEGTYSTETYTALQAALENAKTVLADTTSAQCDLDEAQKALEDAYDLLAVDTSKLKVLLDQWLEVNYEDYSKESYYAYDQAFRKALVVYLDETSTQTQIDLEAEKLKSAYDALTTDKTGLLDIIEAAKEVVKEDYSEASYANMLEVLTKAEAVYADTDAKQKDINNVIDELKVAIEALSVDKSSLKELTDKYANVEADKYTEESYKEYQDAYNKALDVYEDENATQSEIDSAIKELEDKYNALKEKVTIDVEDETDKDNVTDKEEDTTDKEIDTSDNAQITLFALLALASLLVFIKLKRKELN